jgi:hypothetical protein
MSRKLLLLIPALYAGTALRAQSIVSSSNPHSNTQRLKQGQLALE